MLMIISSPVFSHLLKDVYASNKRSNACNYLLLCLLSPTERCLSSITAHETSRHQLLWYSGFLNSDSSQERVNFCSSQERTWLEPRGYSIPPPIMFWGRGKGSHPGGIVWQHSQVLAELPPWWALTCESFASLHSVINTAAVTVCFLISYLLLFAVNHSYL